jgi:hypothetical protein
MMETGPGLRTSVSFLWAGFGEKTGSKVSVLPADYMGWIAMV